MVPPPPPSAHAKPTAVSTAILLQLVAVALGIVNMFLSRSWDPSRLPPQAAQALEQLPPWFFPAVLFSSLVIGWTIMFWLLYKTNRGRNWARITLLVLFLLSLPSTIKTLLQWLGSYPVPAVIGIAGLILQIVSYCLLFSRAAKPWFQPVPPPLQPGASATPGYY